MTVAPETAELLALADCVESQSTLHAATSQRVAKILRSLATKPDEDGAREALKFYADVENYRSGDTHVNGMTRPVMPDRGNKARAALSSTGEPKP